MVQNVIGQVIGQYSNEELLGLGIKYMFCARGEVLSIVGKTKSYCTKEAKKRGLVGDIYTIKPNGYVLVQRIA